MYEVISFLEASYMCLGGLLLSWDLEAGLKKAYRIKSWTAFQLDYASGHGIRYLV
jgi:hypothetical protein